MPKNWAFSWVLSFFLEFRVFILSFSLEFRIFLNAIYYTFPLLYAAKVRISLFSQYHTMFLLRKNSKESTNFLKYAEKLSFGLEFEFFSWVLSFFDLEFFSRWPICKPELTPRIWQFLTKLRGLLQCYSIELSTFILNSRPLNLRIFLINLRILCSTYLVTW